MTILTSNRPYKVDLCCLQWSTSSSIGIGGRCYPCNEQCTDWLADWLIGDKRLYTRIVNLISCRRAAGPAAWRPFGGWNGWKCLLIWGSGRFAPNTSCPLAMADSEIQREDSRLPPYWLDIFYNHVKIFFAQYGIIFAPSIYPTALHCKILDPLLAVWRFGPSLSH